MCSLLRRVVKLLTFCRKYRFEQQQHEIISEQMVHQAGNKPAVEFNLRGELDGLIEWFNIFEQINKVEYPASKRDRIKLFLLTWRVKRGKRWYMNECV